jgi:hypothetical protein
VIGAPEDDRIEVPAGWAEPPDNHPGRPAARTGQGRLHPDPAGGPFIRATGLVPVDLIDIPDGLNAAELKKYLLENGSKIVGARGLS